MIPVSEVFLSVQGEGIRTGPKTLFLRVAGCNLAEEGHPCQWCDTSYAWRSSQGKSFPVEEIKEQVENVMMVNNVRELSITGGEPLYHPELKELIYWWSRKYNLTVETNGSLPIWSSQCLWSVDLKCPSSGNSEHNLYDNLALLEQKDQLKCVIGNREDYEFARKIVISRVVLTNVIFQPVWRILPPKTLAQWLIEDKELTNVKLGIQLHKIIWPRRKKGI